MLCVSRLLLFGVSCLAFVVCCVLLCAVWCLFFCCCVVFVAFYLVFDDCCLLVVVGFGGVSCSLIWCFVCVFVSLVDGCGVLCAARYVLLVGCCDLFVV